MNILSSALIKKEALKIGFSDCGIAQVESLSKQKEYFSEWLKKRYHSDMKYLENNINKRMDPSILFEGAKTIVVCSINYFNSVDIFENSELKLSKYAFGKDYHIVIKEKLQQLFNFIRKFKPTISGKICVDTSPIMEKVWAEKSGIGWIGKNTCLISKKNGSFCFLGEIILNIELEYDQSAKHYCGTCNKCIEACPTKAIEAPFILNANKCLSYITIESKAPMNDEIAKKSNGWFFGCDICQDVCPWNKRNKIHDIQAFSPNNDLKKLIKNEIIAYSEEEFKNKFKESAINRVKYNVLKENIIKVNLNKKNQTL